MKPQSNLDKILAAGVVCAIGGGTITAEQALRVIEALVRGGMTCFELMRGVPNAVSLVRELKGAYPNAAIGIGTILDTEAAAAAIHGHADFLVSPCANPAVIKACRRHGVVSCLGALTPSEILLGWEAGLDLVKVFPTSAMGGAEYIRTLKAPYPHIRLVGAGGVTLEQVPAYFAAGASLVAVDEDLVRASAIGEGDYASLTERAREYRAVLERI